MRVDVYPYPFGLSVAGLVPYSVVVEVLLFSTFYHYSNHNQNLISE